MDPARLSRYIDSPSCYNFDGKVRPQTHGGSIQRSWNGENADTTPFSRLDKRGKVVLLENDNIHSTVLGTTPLHNPNVRVRCLETEILENAGPSQANMSLVLKAQEAVQNNTLVSTAQVGYARNASAGLQEGIMTPAQRRERLQFETTSQNANAIKKKSELKERRLIQLMFVSLQYTWPKIDSSRQHQYPCGVLGLDGPNNPESVVFAASAQRIEKQRIHKERQHEAHKNSLLRNTSVIPALGYSYLEHDTSVKPPQVTKVCQEKIKLSGTHLATHNRIFNETPPVWHPERAQHLRDEGQAGRSYDIVNKGRIEYFAPSIPEKNHPRQAHPSISIHSMYKLS
ncbi:hypothetical protein Ae201684P_008439 [Aphanomyces euteiches]|nr:hypothetical protein Ae201684P_008439 [Aphanomyces euteiches]KAH9157630.1 hypothetical protein AeRB84_000566 [Aphanomyces euteiches]